MAQNRGLEIGQDQALSTGAAIDHGHSFHPADLEQQLP